MALWNGDNVTSGLIGFAYPALTSAYPGNESAPDYPNSTIQYNPWIFTAIGQGLIDPIFSLTLQRGGNESGGQLAIGGLPPICHNLTYTTTDLHLSDLTNRAGASVNFTFYSIIPDGFKLVGQEQTPDGPQAVNVTRSTNDSVIVDSGTTALYLAPRIAEAVNSLYNPPSRWVPSLEIFVNVCNAVSPALAFTIAGTDFWVSLEDMLLGGEDPETGDCMTGVQLSFDDSYILGDVFLKNVVAAFDIGNSQMHFAPHAY